MITQKTNKNFKDIHFIEDDTKVFSSYDLGAISALVTLGYKLLKIDKGHGAKALFIFEESRGLVKSAQQYWNDELQVSALSYFEAMKRIKNQLYSD